jgi:folate-binding protein YgfZ
MNAAPSPRAQSLVVCELPQLAFLRISGADAQRFLHAQLTCDVNALGPGRSTFGAYCTPRGRVLASFLLWRESEDYLVQLPAELCAPIAARLSRYVLRSRVALRDETSERVAIGVAGKDAAARLHEAIGLAPQRLQEVAVGPEASVIRIAAERFEIVAARAAAPALLEALAPGAERADAEYWAWLDIRAGVPAIAPATQEEFVPQAIHLDRLGAVSYTKGCYPGQEIIARTHHLGRLKQRMYLAHLAGPERPAPGDRLYSPEFGTQASGTVVSAARAPGGGHDLLAVLQIESAEGGNVRWREPDGPPLEIRGLAPTGS